jgi:hypothetical protein
MTEPAPITIPTEPIGSFPRTADLIDRVAKGDARWSPGRITAGVMRTVYF